MLSIIHLQPGQSLVMPSSRLSNMALRLPYDVSQHEQQEAYYFASLMPRTTTEVRRLFPDDGPYAVASMPRSVLPTPSYDAGVATRGSREQSSTSVPFGLPPWRDLQEVVLTDAQRLEGHCAITDVALVHLKHPVVCFVGRAVHVFCWHGLNQWVRARGYRCRSTAVFKNPYNREEMAITKLYRVPVAQVLASPAGSTRGERSPSVESRLCPHKSA